MDGFGKHVCSALLIVVASMSGPASAQTRRVPQCRLATEMGIGPWAGGCRSGRAEGHGAGRMRTADGAGVFAGRTASGRPVSGVTILDDGGWAMVTDASITERPGMDHAALMSEQAYSDAYHGASTAGAAYRSLGNAASSRYYFDLHDRLVRGTPE